jgi:hypothetical protein
LLVKLAEKVTRVTVENWLEPPGWWLFVTMEGEGSSIVAEKNSDLPLHCSLDSWPNLLYT